MFDVSDNVQKINVINRRLFIITAAKILVFIGLTSRLFSLQVSQSNKYLTLSDKNLSSQQNQFTTWEDGAAILCSNFIFSNICLKLVT